MSTVVSSAETSSMLNRYIEQQRKLGAGAATIADANGPVAPTTTSTSTTGGIVASYDTFIKLLLTQLKNQDPTAPMDTDKITQQLTQFSGVEQQINSNKKLDQIISFSGAGSVAQLSGFIGKKVEAASSGGAFALQNSAATLKYNLPTDLSRATVKISDSSGKVVRTVNVSETSGNKTFVWDGKDDQGTSLTDGIYSAALTLANKSGKTVAAPAINFLGNVTGIQNISGGVANLSIGDLMVNLADVKKVIEG